MARCGTCGNALCACRIYQDGAVLLTDVDGAAVPDNEGSREGRRTTVVSGNGTAGDPYEISFIDSLEYRPQAGEIRRDTADVVGPATAQNVSFEFILYQTPSDNPIMFHEPVGFADDVNLNSLEFIFFGASAKFAGGALGQNKMMISFSGKESARIMGGHTTQFRSGMTTSELTGSGFLNPLFWTAQGASGGIIGIFQVRYSSVDPLVNARFWVTTT